MAAKVSFDSSTKIVTVTEAPDIDGFVDLDVKVDLYSDGKEDWITDASLNKFRFFMRAVGGDDLPGSKVLGSTFFLQHGWRIRPYEASHTLRVNGNLYTDEGESPFISTVGSYNVMVISSVSSLVDSTVAQLPQIEYASFNGCVTIDADNGLPGTDFPLGTSSDPVNNLADAQTIAIERGFNSLCIGSDFTIGATDVISDYRLIGHGRELQTTTLISGCATEATTFERMSVSGTQNGGTQYLDCEILDLSNVHCGFHDCKIVGPLYMSETSQDTTFFHECYSGVAGAGTPTIDMRDGPMNMAFRAYSGGLKFSNVTDSRVDVSVDLVAGQVILDSTVTDGNIHIRGVGTHTDNSGGTANINVDGLVSKANISSAVWDEQVVNHDINGTSGEALTYLLYDGAIWIDTLGDGEAGTEYPVGTIAHPVDNMADAMVIAASVGLKTFKLKGTLVIGMDHVGWQFFGQSSIFTDVIVLTGTDVSNSLFDTVSVVGTMSGSSVNMKQCLVQDLTGADLVSVSTVFAGTITSAGPGTSILGGTANFMDIPTVFDMVGTGRTVSMEGGGDVQVNNLVAGSLFTIGFTQGTCILDSSCTGGTAIISGNCLVTDNSGGAVTLINQSLPHTVWNYDISDMSTPDTAGFAIRKALGLIHENIVIDNNVYDGNNQLTSSRVRIFGSTADAAAATYGGVEPGDPTPLETYLATASWAGLNQMTLFKQVVI